MEREATLGNNIFAVVKLHFEPIGHLNIGYHLAVEFLSMLRGGGEGAGEGGKGGGMEKGGVYMRGRWAEGWA